MTLLDDPATPASAPAPWSSLAWRAPVGALLGVLAAVPLLLLALAVLSPVLVHDASSAPQTVVLLTLARLVVITGSVVIGLLLALGVVVLLEGQRRDGRRLSLRRAGARALRRMPVLLAAIALHVLYVLFALLAALVLVLAAAVRLAYWERRRRGALSPEDLAHASGRRRAAAIDLVPFAVLVRALTQLALVVPAALLGGGPLRTVLPAIRTAARGRTLTALRYLALPLLANAFLTMVVLPRTEAAAAARPAGEAYGATAAQLGVAVLGLLVLGAGLARLAHAAGVDLTPVMPREPRPHNAISLLRWRASRTATAALISCIALVSTSLDPAPAVAALPGDIVVDTLSDSLTPDPAECQAGAACSLRGALALAAAQASATISFSVSGTVATLDTLHVPDGVTIDGHDGIVLDGGRTHRVLQAGAGDGGSVTLAHLRVTGGRSDAGGAGLNAGAASVTLDSVQFSDNVSGTDGDTGVDGGAVAALHTRVTVRSSTFDHNIALAGRGGAVAALRLDWQNSTSYADRGISGDAIGGAVHARFGGTVLHGTFVAGGGVAGDESYPLSVVNSISDPDGTIGAFPCQYVTGPDDADPSIGNVDVSGMCGVGLKVRPGPLGPLAANGGPTDTVALLHGSQALSAADAAACAAVDQRGRTRSASSCDAGAFQLGTGDVRPVVSLVRIEGGDALDVVAVASVEVPAGSSPTGTVTLLDGSTEIGDPVQVTATGTPTSGTARIPVRLTPGRHLLAVRFDPDSAAIAAATSPATEYVAREDARLHVTAPPPALVGAPTTLTVTAESSSSALLRPTGEVVLSNGAEEKVLTLVDGSATWSVPVLRRGTVTAAYRGDDAYRAVTSSSVVTSSDVASATTLVLADRAPESGASVPASVQVTGGGTGAYGRVLLQIDGADHDGGAVVAGVAELEIATGALSVGTHTAKVTFTAEPGWRDSATTVTFEVVPASLTVGVTVAPASIRWGDLATAAVTVTAPRDGPITLELIGGDDVLATKPALVESGSASASFDLVQLVRPLTGELRVRASGDESFGTGLSEPAVLAVEPAPTALSLSTPSFPRFPPQVGKPMALRVDIRPLTASYVRVEGVVEIFLDDVSAGVFPTTQEGFDVSVTPTVGGTVAARAVFTDTSASPTLLRSGTEKLLQIAAAPSDEPVLVWSGDLRPGATNLDVTFPGAGTASAPTGVVTIVDGLGLSRGSATLSSGSATVAFDGHAITYAGTLRLQYSGDVSHAAGFFFLPPVTIRQHESTTTLSGVPPELARDTSVVLTATVTGVPAGTHGRILLLDGTYEVAAADVSSDVPAQLVFSSWQLRVHTLTARFVPADALDVRGSDSAPATVEVVDHPVPTMTLSLPAPATAGEPFSVAVAAPAGQAGLPAGAWVSIVRTDDIRGEGLAGGRLVKGSGGLSASISVPPQDGGELSLTAVFTYGDYGQQGRSAPLVLQVGRVTPSLRLSTATKPVVGDLVQVLVEADVAPSLRAGAGVLSVQVVVGTQPPREVVLLRSDDVTRPIWSGSFLHHMEHGGDLRVTASTTGDGRSAGPASAETTFVVARRAVRLALRDEGGSFMFGSMPRPIAVSVSAIGGAFTRHPSAEGVLVSGEGDAPACVTRSRVCELPQYAVPAGTSQVRGWFAGDADFLPAEGFLTVEAQPRLSSLQTRFDPEVEEWQSGQQVKVTWTVEATGAPARGEAVFSLGGNVCRGPAPAGSCTTTVPAWAGNGPTPELTLVEEYRPRDDAPAVKRSSTVVPRTCVRVTVPNGHVRGDTGERCTVNGTSGYLTGSEITVIPSLAGPHFHADSWSVNGVLVTDGVRRSAQLDTRVPQPKVEESLTFGVRARSEVTFTQRYAPACVLLTTEPVRNVGPEMLGGRTSVRTPPTCTAGLVPSEEELEQARLGQHWFLLGTRVQLAAYALNPHGSFLPTIVENPAFAADGWINAVADPEDIRLATVEMTEDTNVTAVFKVAHCTATSVLPSEGGTMTIRYTERPERTRFLEPYSGACTTQDGRSGYVPGTRVHVHVVPDNDGSRLPAADPSQYFFEEVLLATTAPTPRAHGQRPDPGSYVPRMTSLKVLPTGTAPDARLAARFGHVSCVPLTTRLELPDTAAAPTVTYDAPSNCPAHPATASTEPVPGSTFVTHVKTAHYVEGSEVSVSVGETRAVVRYPRFTRNVVDFRKAPTAAVVPDECSGELATTLSSLGCDTVGRTTVSTAPPPVDDLAYQRAQGDPTASEDVLQPVWAVARRGHPVESATGPGRDIAMVAGTDPVVMGRWTSKLCRSLSVYAPEGGTVTQSPVTPQCRKGSYPVYVTALQLEVQGGPDSPFLKPWLSVGGNAYNALYTTATQIGNNGRRYPVGSGHSVQLNTYDPVDVTLEFCARLDYSVQVNQADGVKTWPPGVRNVIQTDGGCPQGWSRPGRTVTMGLTEQANYAYELLGPELHRPSTVQVDDQGRTSRVNYVLRPYCHRLSVGRRVAVQTAANCPGAGDGHYLRGEVVELRMDLQPGESFRGWSGVDASDGITAFVAMTEDRVTGSDVSFPSDLEKTGAVLSSVVQRTVGLAMTIGTAFVMAKAAVLSTVATAMKAAAWIAKKAGAPSGFVDGVTAARDFLNAQVRIINALALCTSQWASGGSASVVPNQGVTGAAAAAAAKAVAAKAAGAVAAGMSSGEHTATVAALNPILWANAYGAEAANYLRNPRDAWSDIGSIGSCMRDEVSASVDASATAVGR